MKRGRPNRSEASRKALRGVDVEAVDPVTVLKRIASDESAPAMARATACRLLLAERERERLEARRAESAWLMPGEPPSSTRTANDTEN